MSDTTEATRCFIAPIVPLKSDEQPETTLEKKDDLEAPNLKSKSKSDNPKINVPLPYTEPEWGGIPPPKYSFEVIKNGTLLSNVGIRSSLVIFGRLEVCDFVFEHPSVSRYHAVVQYCKGDDSHPKGFYLYDLGSTHGTFLNKQPVKSKIYYLLKVGYVLKFGGSSRLHIFQGPEEEEVEMKKPEVEKSEEICTWGIGDDACEEDTEGVNPFALSTTNEELYLEDPKKTLRGWFEREGYEVEYNVEEKGFRTFSCSVRLPIDTPTGEFLPVEASVSGKKKEAVIACALEACRTLDRLGLLRQSHHESRQRKRKKWEENDYYDSDEDTFYDRTGEIEKRREMRKRIMKKTDVTENFESLTTKHKVLLNEIEDIEAKLAACAAKDILASKHTEEDSLEMYMSDLTKSANAPTDKFEKRKLKLRMVEAQKEKLHLEKLLNIARPASLPPVVKVTGFIGKKLKSKFQLPKTNIMKPKIEKEEECQVEEVESDAENDKISTVSEKVVMDTTSNEKDKKYGLLVNVKHDDSNTETYATNAVTASVGEEQKIELDSFDVQPIDDIDCSVSKSANEKKFQNCSPITKRAKKTSKKLKDIDVYETKTSDYVTWTPPTNQSGDGITHLNAKYGY